MATKKNQMPPVTETQSVAPEKPNILFFMADQLSPHVLPMFKQQNRSRQATAYVPTLNRLAEEGVVFDNCYCNSPLCAPARASLETGMRVRDHRVYGNGAEFSAAIPTMMHHLKANGYYTAVSGKTHFVGPDQLHGFDDRFTTDIYPSDFSWTPNWEAGVKHAPGTSVEKLKVSGLCRTVRSLKRQSTILTTDGCRRFMVRIVISPLKR